MDVARDDAFTLTPNVAVICTDRLQPFAERFAADLAIDTGVAFRLVDDVDTGTGASIYLDLVDADEELAGLPSAIGVSPTQGDCADERYRLTVTGDNIRIAATAVEGVYRGLTTLRQLIGAATLASAGVIPNDLPVTLPAVRIVDAPRFAWRGLTVDVGRTFLTVEEIEQIIDMLALYKFNVLHLHLTEDAGWRLEILSRPKLTEVGAEYSLGDRPGGFYKQSDFARLVSYAAERFITVVPEIGLPGHATAAIRSYPELAADGVAPEAARAPGLYTAALNLDVPGTAEFIADVFTEVAALTSGPYIHIGGDEAFGVSDESYEAVVAHAVKTITALGKRVVGWQETARADVAQGQMVHYWIDRAEEFAEQFSSMDGVPLPEGVNIPAEFLPILIAKFTEAAKDPGRAAEKGAKIVLSPTRYTYLDVPYSEASADPAQEADRARLGISVYPRTTVQEALDWNPETLLAAVTDADGLAGVEAAIWSETVENAADAHFLLLPRLPGVAERAWSPQDALDWDSYADDLASHGSAWTRRGWNYFRSSLIDWK
jgi:hexosaminidase